VQEGLIMTITLDAAITSTATIAAPDLRAVAVIGLGYVGRPLALEFYRHGHTVVGYDITRARRTQAEHEAFEIAAARGASFRTADDAWGMARCNAYVVAVPTPIDEHDKPDLSLVEMACHEVGAVLSRGDLVSFESTVWAGVTRRICLPILEAESGLVAGRDFHLAFSPERVAPGEAEVTKIVKVVGGLDEASFRAAWELYEPIIEAGLVGVSSLEAAEMTKLVENTQRDVNIAFINEMNDYARALDIDFHEVLAACRTKWSFKDFRPGLVGGHCIAVDPYYLLEQATGLGVDMSATAAARRTNDGYHERLATRIEALVADRDERPAIVVYGSTYKANVDDTRNSGPLRLAETMRTRGYDVTVVDRLIDPEAAAQALLAGPGQDAIVVVAVVHDEFAGTLTADVDALAGPSGLVVAITDAVSADQIPARLELTTLL
jgi:UDP-N-acetyl-D-galactosamine dehydrogenase